MARWWLVQGSSNIDKSDCEKIKKFDQANPKDQGTGCVKVQACSFNILTSNKY